jgi:hypothetical protein
MPDLSVEIQPPTGHLERLIPDPHIAELRRPTDPGDPAMPERRDVIEGRVHRRRTVGPHAWHPVGERRIAHEHSRQTQPPQQRDARIGDPQIDHDHTVHPAFRGPLPVRRLLLLEIGDDLQSQRVRLLPEHGLDATHEAHEIRLLDQGLRASGEDEPERLAPRRGQLPGGAVGHPLQLRSHLQDPRPGRLGDPGLVVERVRHRALGDPTAAGDLLDRHSGHDELLTGGRTADGSVRNPSVCADFYNLSPRNRIE